jgi:hypothetical protein
VGLLAAHGAGWAIACAARVGGLGCPVQVVRDRGRAVVPAAGLASPSAATSCCDKGGRTMNGTIALTSMIAAIT